MLDNLFKTELSLIGNLPLQEVKEKWKRRAAEQKDSLPDAVVGKPYFIYEYDSTSDLYKVSFHHNYKKDFCDSVFGGNFSGYDEEILLSGHVFASKSSKKFAVLFLVITIILAVVYFIFPLFGYMLYVSLGLIAIGVLVFIASLKVDRERIKAITSELQGFINEVEK